jgi:hypothetical protein
VGTKAENRSDYVQRIIVALYYSHELLWYHLTDRPRKNLDDQRVMVLFGFKISIPTLFSGARLPSEGVRKLSTFKSLQIFKSCLELIAYCSLRITHYHFIICFASGHERGRDGIKRTVTNADDGP